MTERRLPYQPYYCEENVWKLLEGDHLSGRERFALVVSNTEGACPMWTQRHSPDPGRPVVWDYHVVALTRDGDSICLWDLDSELGRPLSLGAWLEGTFPRVERLPSRFRPRFRIVPAPIYLEVFSSDRSHMRDEEGEWKRPPPEWPAIFREDRGMNLDRFTDMEADFVGDVSPYWELRSRLLGTGARSE